MSEEINEKIEEAKKVAKDNYDGYMKKIHCDNPDYERKWIKHDFPEKNATIFALEGSPDKAFVKVDNKTGKVTALNQLFEILKEFN